MAVGILEQVKNVGVCEGAGGEQGASGDGERDRTERQRTPVVSIDASLPFRASSLYFTRTHSHTHTRSTQAHHFICIA